MIWSLHAQHVPSHADNPLEFALRTAAVIYVEALVPDKPGNPLVYGPLNLLPTSVRAIVQLFQERQPKTEYERPSKHSCDEDYADKFSSTATSKPVLIWICLVGSVVAKLYDMELVTLGIYFDRDCYGKILSRIVGPEPENADQLQGGDLALCKVIDGRGLRIKPHDKRVLLKRLLLGSFFPF
ncbi:hypothetical protein CI238_10844 [Colletotrichum incanum]|uniref:Uncharacterized protein n=1 Tax=Colletotrichum incanum TaxID=1573173 RepID=A0A162MYF3_COLIC|nr:hypothetical protein CI238_10844 [Colletotrichum incanum]